MLLSLVCALTVWSAMLAWGPLTEEPDRFVAPLLVSALALSLTGAALRATATPAVLVIAVQALLASGALLWSTSGAPWPTTGAITTTVEALRSAVDSAGRFAVPVPVDPHPVTPLFLAVGLGALVVADTLALTWRRVPLAGVPLMVVLLIPTNLALDLSWWLFAAVAAGFLLLLRLDRLQSVMRWGRDVDNTVRTRVGNVGTTVGLGGATLACAFVAGTVVPVADLGLIDRAGMGSGGQQEVRLTNPLIDMRRNLTRGADVPLLQVVSPSQRPSYLATTVLAEFNGREWTSGDRNATADQRAEGRETPPPGVDPGLDRTAHPMEITAMPAFRSRWLALPQHATRVLADGDWRRDVDTQDYVAWDNELTTSDLTWTAEGTDLELDHVDLDGTRTGRTSVSTVYTDLPDSLPDEVRRLAADVTAGEETAFRRARALQTWFRSEFTYSLERVESVGNDELLAFLSEDGREGYCEQFAGAMAVMARALDIPSRVMVGFLSPDQLDDDTWEFSAHDLHAWPELYFPGSGWVRFEPTPAARTSSPPSYTVSQLPSDEEPEQTAEPTPTETAEPTRETSPEETDATATPEETADESFSWAPLLRGVFGALLAAGVLSGLAAPAVVRRRRRHRRRASATSEDLWNEVRDEVVDLGFTWPEGRSPREAGNVLRNHVQEAELTPDEQESTQAALERLVATVEHDRYARPGSVLIRTSETLVADAALCTDALRTAAGPHARRRAQWWPKSVFGPTRDRVS